MGLRTWTSHMRQAPKELRVQVTLALALKAAALVVCFIGLTRMRRSFHYSGLEERDANILPWATAGVVVMAVVLTVPDLLVAESVMLGRAPRCCAQLFAMILQPALWLIVLIFGVAAAAYTVGFGVLGLTSNENLEGDFEIMFGMTGDELMALAEYADTFKNGAMLLALGSFLSVVAQGMLMSASIQNSARVKGANTPYVPPARLDTTPREDAPLLGDATATTAAQRDAALLARKRLELSGYA